MKLVISDSTITPMFKLSRYALSSWKCEIMKCIYRGSMCKGTKFGSCYRMCSENGKSKSVPRWLIACNEYRSEIYL